eukprot:CAMPEP_0174328300 /NCGR_PEP_ID=MMETSP0810-20121108/15049_1 /TAXON_ID=73025 ORGANISM="Eutreptiella gymnastica-like, Strain CCMP1594" /NCGR_SAMPLE_ID=MMETSP0810 /ASSEMBLY_ACC=CAM_ASM_000659 /LENGTH=64 /DNA_ID=CAMNT_0015442349 /DNA_START=185 /DNA_END=379 /DNA_ORIENTATION=+
MTAPSSGQWPGRDRGWRRCSGVFSNAKAKAGVGRAALLLCFARLPSSDECNGLTGPGGAARLLY